MPVENGVCFGLWLKQKERVLANSQLEEEEYHEEVVSFSISIKYC